MCPNGTVQWKAIYGEDEFVIKAPVFESDLRARRALKTVDAAALAKSAREFAEVVRVCVRVFARAVPR